MLKIAVLVSGGGTNLQALLDAEKSGQLHSGRIALVVSSREGAYALTRAAVWVAVEWSASIPRSSLIVRGMSLKYLLNRGFSSHLV